jgi:hypothetical protein
MVCSDSGRASPTGERGGGLAGAASGWNCSGTQRRLRQSRAGVGLGSNPPDIWGREERVRLPGGPW